MSLKKLFSAVLVTVAINLIASEEAEIDKFWDYRKIIETEDNNYLRFSGRLHLDCYSFKANQGQDDGFTWRRFRFGLSAKHSDFYSTVEGDFNFNNSRSDIYRGLTDANITWKPSKEFSLTMLKHSARFTLDGKTSSKKILTPQRNNLSNNLWFTHEYFTGVSAKGNIDKSWSYNCGFFSSDPSNEIGAKEASYFTVLTLDRKFEESDLWDKGILSLDYVYNDVHENGATRDFSDIISLSSNFEKDQFGISTDLAAGRGDFGQSDLWGLVIMPYFKQNDRLHWVMRYTYLESKDINGLRLDRYENSIVSGRGDRYNEIFGGINILLNEHKLKFQIGVQYANMQDSANDGGAYNGWGLTTSLRAYW